MFSQATFVRTSSTLLFVFILPISPCRFPPGIAGPLVYNALISPGHMHTPALIMFAFVRLCAAIALAFEKGGGRVSAPLGDLL